jgi:hypothetical protein
MAKKRRTSKRRKCNQAGMTPAEVRAYFARWKRVEEFIAAERCALTPAQKFDQWIQLMKWTALFPAPHSRTEENREVRERWIRLRKIYRDET